MSVCSTFSHTKKAFVKLKNVLKANTGINTLFPELMKEVLHLPDTAPVSHGLETLAQEQMQIS